MADTLLAGEPNGRGGDRYQVVVHVDAAELRDGNGDGELADGTPIAPDTVRRLACDASIVPLIERAGRPLSVGRKTRSIPPALRRALESRDRGCRFPGCTNARTVDAQALLVVAGAPFTAQWATASLALDGVAPASAGAEAYNWLSAANAAGVALGSLAAGGLVAAAGTTAAFLAAAALVGMAAAYVLVRSPRADRDEPARAGRSAG